MRMLSRAGVVGALVAWSAVVAPAGAQAFQVPGNNVAMKVNPATGLTYYIDDTDKGAPVVVVRNATTELSRTAMNICAGCRIAGNGVVGTAADQTLAYTVKLPTGGDRSYIGNLDSPGLAVQISGQTQVTSVTQGRVFGIAGNAAAELRADGLHVLFPFPGSSALTSFTRGGQVGYAGGYTNPASGNVEGYIYLNGILTNPLDGQTFDASSVFRASVLGNFFGLKVDNDLGSIIQLFDWNTGTLYDFDHAGGLLGGSIAHVSESGWMVGFDGNGFDYAVNPFLHGRKTFSFTDMCALQGNDCSWVQSVNAGTEYFDAATGNWIASYALSGSAGGSTGSVGKGIYDATTVVPEPATGVLLGTGLLGVAGMVRRRRRLY